MWKLDTWKVRPRPVVTDKALLRQKSKPIYFVKDAINKDLVQLIKTLYYTLNAQEKGMRLGMAAPQIGVLKRVFIMEDRIFVNPQFTPSKAPLTRSIEGCYSCGKDGELYEVERANSGFAYWQDSHGGRHEEKLNGIRAIIFQHELAHLDGKIISDEGTLVPSKKDSPSP